MITNPVNIVGCGTIGSCLALKLSEEKLISKLNIYDFDIVSEHPSYPFLKNESGIHKIRLIEFLCKKHHPSLVIKSHLQKITSPLNFKSFTIDCRDSKSTNINAQIRVSLDGHLLYIDSLKNIDHSKDYHRYISPRNEKYINKSIEIVIDYLKNDEYKFQDLKLYNLIYNDSFIIKKENF